MRVRLPPPKCMAVDVDGTLIVGGEVNAEIVESMRRHHAAGWELVIWSMRGRANAERAAADAGLSEVAVCISKPGIIVDDDGLEWLRGVEVLGRAKKR